MAAVALVVVGVAAVALAQLGTCDEVSLVRRRSYEFLLCGTADELIAKIPVVGPADEPLFSWRYADGMKPGLWRLEYESRSTSAEIRAALQPLLAARSFAPLRGEVIAKELGAGYDWWADGRSWLGVALTPATGGKGTKVNVVHNTGHD